MAFTTTPSKPIGRLRLEIGDSVEGQGPRVDGRNFSDEELEVIIEENGSWRAAVPAALTILANEYASAAGTIRFADYAESFNDRAAQLRKQAADAEEGLISEKAGKGVIGKATEYTTVDIVY